MKRMFVIAMVLFLGLSHSTTAQDNTTHAIQLPQVLDVQPTDKAGVYQATFTGPMTEKVVLSLFDEEGHRLSSKQLRNTATFSQLYNLQSVAAGDYTWKLETPYTTVSSTVAYEGLPEPAITLLPSREPSRLRLLLEDSAQEPLTVSVFDEKDRLLHMQTVSPEKYEQNYNLAQIEGSTVTFVVMNSLGKTASETYRIR